MLGYFDIFAPDPHPHRMGWGRGAGANKKYRFSRQFMKCLRHLKFLPIKLPTPGGVGWDFCLLLLFSAVHDISRTFDFLTP